MVQREPAAPPVQRKPASPNSAVPDPGTVEAAMLELLRLPPDTAVVGLRKPADSAPPPAAAPLPPAPTPPNSTAPPIQTKRLDEALADSEAADSDVVQRALGTGEASAFEGEGSGATEPDVEELARKVYNILKQRLRIERERSPR
jgi:hypothetical protein